jgi:hypothetical protein
MIFISEKGQIRERLCRMDEPGERSALSGAEYEPELE